MPENIKRDKNNAKFSEEKPRLNFSEIDYLCFEGGGGKGTGYQGAVRALEFLHNNKYIAKHEKKKLILEKYKGRWPIFPLLLPPAERKFKGVSGTSAGAITAFLLALGIPFSRILHIFNVTSNATVDALFFRSKTIPINDFERFMGEPRIGEVRMIEKNHQTSYEHKALSWIYTPIEQSLLIALRVLRSFFQSNRRKRMYFYQRILSTDGTKNPANYLKSVLSNRGLFAGFEVRTLYTKLLKENLLDKLSTYKIELDKEESAYDASTNKTINDLKASIRRKIQTGYHGDLSFREFYYLTGVDLVVCSTNMSRGRTFYFSAYHTPEFPVVEAVAMSMNFPFVFKPIYLNTDVISDSIVAARRENSNMSVYYENYNLNIRGLYADGGVIHNFPMHAFDHTMSLESIEREEKCTYLTATDPTNKQYELSTHVPFGNYDFNLKTVAFNLRSRPPHKELKDFTLFPKSPLCASSYIGNLTDSFMFPGSDGMVRTREEYNNVIDVDVFIENPKFDENNRKSSPTLYSIDLLDFATPDLDRKRDQKQRGDYKEQVLNTAYEHVLLRFATLIFFLLAPHLLHAQVDANRQYPRKKFIAGLGYNLDSLQRLPFKSDFINRVALFPYIPRYTLNYISFDYASSKSEKGILDKKRTNTRQTAIAHNRYMIGNRFLSGPVFALNDSGKIFFLGKLRDGCLIDTASFHNGMLRFIGAYDDSVHYIKPLSPLYYLFEDAIGSLYDPKNSSWGTFDPRPQSYTYLSEAMMSFEFDGEAYMEYNSLGHDVCSYRQSGSDWRLIYATIYTVKGRIEYEVTQDFTAIKFVDSLTIIWDQRTAPAFSNRVRKYEERDWLTRKTLIVGSNGTPSALILKQKPNSSSFEAYVRVPDQTAGYWRFADSNSMDGTRYVETHKQDFPKVPVRHLEHPLQLKRIVENGIFD